MKHKIRWSKTISKKEGRTTLKNKKQIKNKPKINTIRRGKVGRRRKNKTQQRRRQTGGATPNGATSNRKRKPINQNPNQNKKRKSTGEEEEAMDVAAEAAQPPACANAPNPVIRATMQITATDAIEQDKRDVLTRTSS